MLLTENNIKSEISYAYLHAVASRAGFACEVTGRHSDAAGIDAVLRAKERMSPDSILTSFPLEVQLKATSQKPVLQNDKYSHVLRIKHYDKLRNIENLAQILLVVLFLPKDPGKWLTHTEESLVIRRCAYWVSLKGEPESDNQDNQTVYLPKENDFSVEQLRSLMERVSKGEELTHAL